MLPDGKSLNQELVRAGLAWWYRKYAPRDNKLEALEKQAKAAKRGLWKARKRISPWKWRRLR